MSRVLNRLRNSAWWLAWRISWLWAALTIGLALAGAKGAALTDRAWLEATIAPVVGVLTLAALFQLATQLLEWLARLLRSAR